MIGRSEKIEKIIWENAFAQRTEKETHIKM